MSDHELDPLTLPTVDAHQHFWDPARNNHPWLCDEPMIPFRYGDYSPIRGSFTTTRRASIASNPLPER